MSFAEEDRAIVEAVAQTYREAGLDWPPEASGPMPLGTLMRAYPVIHEEIAGLNRAVVTNVLGRWGVRCPFGDAPDGPLAGFVYAKADGGYILVRRGDGLPRRRFTAAHELGHYRLHLAPMLERGDSADAGLSFADDEATLKESDGAELAAMERQANRFAAELLMPASVCRDLYADCVRKYGTARRFALYHLANELLVSPTAIEWRLYHLDLVEKPTPRETDDAGGPPEAE